MHSHVLLGLVAAFQLLDAVAAIPFPGIVVRRQEDLKSKYDYVVVGGGTAGLAVANRLSEDEDKSVLVIEAGVLFGDDKEDIMIPGFSSITGTRYQWNVTTQPITSLQGNATFMVPSPKLVGGDSAVNSMSYHHGSREDYDSWERLGNKGWGFDGMLPYFKKCETFHPPTKEQQKEFGITWDPKVRGTSGPIHVKFASYIYPQYRTIADAWKKMGVPIPFDVNNGQGIGSLWIPNPIDPKDETRSYAMAYHKAAVKRSNYHLLVEHQVTKILFDKNKRAIGVNYSKGPKDVLKTATAKTEVILAAGAFHNPKLLQLSGIGAKSLLDEHKIPVLVDLPGVGSNLQDHALTRPLNYTSSPNPPGPWTDPSPSANQTWLDAALAEYRLNCTGWYTRPLAGSTVAYLPLPIVAPSSYRSIISASSSHSADAYLHHRSSPAVVAGYALQKSMILSAFGTHKVAVGEISLRPGIAPGPALIVEKPLSRGYVEIKSADAWENPRVFYRTLSDPADVKILTANLRFSRRLFASQGMKGFKPVETYPGSEVDGDEELAEVVRARVINPSVGHASCTCPMMRREVGGVVDAKLNVYGVKGLRIVDVSVMPIIPSCHMVSTRYAVAEKAADIIRGRHADYEEEDHGEEDHEKEDHADDDYSHDD